MTVQTLHYLAPVKIGTTALLPTATANPLENEIRNEAAGGELTARVQAMIAQRCRPTFSTLDIATALDACGALGVALATKALVLYARRDSDDGRRASSGHRMFTYQHGLLLPQSLDCDHRGDATLSYLGVVTYDGSHEPVVISEDESLPAISSTSLWTLKTATLGGVSVPQLRSVRLGFGLQAAGESADSDVWDTRPSISAITPTVSVTTSKSSALVPLQGGSGAVSLVYRERSDGGTFTGHELTLSGTGLATFGNLFQASGTQPSESTLEASLKYDGVNDPIVISKNW